MSRPIAIVLLSGGLDSTTCLAIAKDEGFTPIALSFRYGQRHTGELTCAAAAAASVGAEHIIADIDPAVFGGSALVDSSIDIPKHASVEELSTEVVPVTYVPARNTIFLSFAIAIAETRGAHDVFIGVNAVDYSGYPDCRPEFIVAFEEMANLATCVGDQGGRLRIRTPLINLTKTQIIELGISLGVDFSATMSCYDPATDGGACGGCDACLLRARGFASAGVVDPTRYAVTR
ncbi:MAG: 7-cyano-7-deazaguanine synthase QueC [Acidimicrobiales bacterium]